MSETQKLLAYNIKRLREKENMSQMDLAVAANLSVAFINSIEHCTKWVSPETLEKIADQLHARVYELFLPQRDVPADLKIAERHHHLIDSLQDIIEKYGKT